MQPGEFGACRGDVALTCNAEGNDFDLLQCPLGCDPAGGGCRLCEPGQTACTNGTLATCDASGAVVESEVCPLGCFEDEPRCRDIDPSNGLAEFLDMVPDPPDLEIASGFIDTTTGEIRDGQTTLPEVPSFTIAAPPGGAPIRVLVLGKVTLGDVTVFGGANALAIVASDAITISGRVVVRPGAVDQPGCVGADSIVIEEQSPTQSIVSGAGGGGFATAGGQGGDVSVRAIGGKGGMVSGTAELEPLRGGCRGGIGGGRGGAAGGALQMSSRVRIEVVGTLNADGATGEFGQATTIGGGADGGGSGGAILLEAPSVALGPSAKLLVRGGGGAGAGPLVPPLDDGSPIPGLPCADQANPFCGDGGDGATTSSAAQEGEDASYDSGLDNGRFSGGGGGGGLGRIRINTADQSFTQANTTITVGSLTTGAVRTR